jgi:hypothetical protein
MAFGLTEPEIRRLSRKGFSARLEAARNVLSRYSIQ